MKFVPHDYQTYCISRMIRERRLGLFLRMGFGRQDDHNTNRP